MIRVFPKLENKKLMDLFHKGVEGQWSAAHVSWDTPIQLDRHERAALGAFLSPVYLGEQTAMVGAGQVIPQFFSAHETEAQLYLSTFLLDEARHFEILTRFYTEMDVRPLRLRDLKDMLRYHLRLYKSGDPYDWQWGILMSDVVAKYFYGHIIKANPDSLFSEIARRILRDEARHLAFSELFLSTAVRENLELRPRFLKMRDELLFLIQSMCNALKADGELIGVDSGDMFGAIAEEVEKKGDRLRLGESTDDLEDDESPA